MFNFIFKYSFYKFYDEFVWSFSGIFMRCGINVTNNNEKSLK